MLNIIHREVQEALPNSSLHDAKLIREKDGVHVYRGILDNQSVVVKFFEKEDDKREISNYRLLNDLEIPTMKVIAYGKSCIVLEDIDCSSTLRLGCKADLQDEELAKKLAIWYFDFHEKGTVYKELDKMYRETDCITRENLSNLSIKLPKAKDTFDYISTNLDNLNKCISEITPTFNYNDFYWTNLLVSKDNSAAMPFDYNLLGAGFRYNDLTNVSSSLSNQAKTTFLNEYNRLYEEKHGHSRLEEELREIQIDRVTSVLISLIVAFERKEFPEWADSSRDEAINGDLLKATMNLFSKI